MVRALASRSILVASLALAACSAGDSRFPLREPMTRDRDLASVYAPCRREHGKLACTPKPYVSSLYWDGADNLIFRPLSDSLGVVTSGESIDVNSLDEVPDSAWFTNRIESITVADLEQGACTPDQILNPEAAPDGSWLIDKGKMDGSTSGFRVIVPGKGKYMIKVESVDDEPERQSAGAVIGASIVHAAGYNTSCEQIVYVRPSVFRLKPGLRARTNFQPAKPFDQAMLDELFQKSPKRNGRVRVSASAWLPGYALGPFRESGTRDDDANDVVPHEDRRELRALRVLAAWIDRTDAREANSFDTWMADDRAEPASSPGHVVHYQFDVSEAFGGDWPWAPAELQRRIGMSYLIDWGDIASSFFSLGIPVRPWEDLTPKEGHEIFGYYRLEGFDPEAWKNEYPNVAFGRMTERDAAWMARILARFTPEMLHALAVMGQFSDPTNTDWLEHVMSGRLDRVLARYLLRLSPIADVRVVSGDQLCGVDLAEWRGVRPESAFRDRARFVGGRGLHVVRGGRGALCVRLEHVAADGGAPDGSPQRYVRVAVADDVARGELVADLYDLGPRRGFRLAGLERPEPR